VRDPALRAEGLGRGGIDVDGGDDLGLPLRRELGERRQVGATGDGTRADDGGMGTWA
jgi:hypothetical protein